LENEIDYKLMSFYMHVFYFLSGLTKFEVWTL